MEGAFAVADDADGVGAYVRVGGQGAQGGARVAAVVGEAALLPDAGRGPRAAPVVAQRGDARRGQGVGQRAPEVQRQPGCVALAVQGARTVQQEDGGVRSGTGGKAQGAGQRGPVVRGDRQVGFGQGSASLDCSQLRERYQM
ncbi:hypothetical protein GCM10010348_21100 [Streptomyces anthocyanicus]|nr:hypothetical protein GCM10010348_21100 [Streptomyces anthocyanicus]